MIDANSNRAREALRVMEDVARFGLDRADLCERVKALRHELAAAIRAAGLDPLGLVAARDTAGDVGTAITATGEGVRRGMPDIAAAACKRLTEALRVIEECVKTCGTAFQAVDGIRGTAFQAVSPGRSTAFQAVRNQDAPLGGKDEDPERQPERLSHGEQTQPERLCHGWELLEALRYRAYDLERDLLLALGTGRAAQWRLCVLISESLCKRPWEEVVAAALDGGADCFQLREKSLDAAELLRRATWLVELCRGRAAVIINDRPDVALLAGADGVHLGQGDLPVRAVRELAGSRLLVGVSTHDMREALAAAADGADYCGVGAMFATSTKMRETSGPGYLRAYLADGRTARIPHLAIGGITGANIGELAAAGCRGVAVSSTVCGAEDPAAVCRELLRGLTSPCPASAVP